MPIGLHINETSMDDAFSHSLKCVSDLLPCFCCFLHDFLFGCIFAVFLSFENKLFIFYAKWVQRHALFPASGTFSRCSRNSNNNCYLLHLLAK